MNRSRSMILFVVILIFSIFNVHSQGVNADNIINPKLKKNAVYGTLGLFPSISSLYGSYSINVERELWHRDRFIKSIRARIGGGEWAVGSIAGEHKEGTHLTGTINFLTGARTFHGEVNLGAIYLYDKIERENHVLPAIRLGIRIQKSGHELGSHFLLRLGAGFPELTYISLGFAF